MNTTLIRGFITAITFATLAGRSADAGVVEQVLAIPAQAQSISFDRFDPALGTLDFVGLAVSATIQPMWKNDFFNSRDEPVTTYAFADYGLHYGVSDVDDYVARGEFAFSPRVVNPGKEVTFTTPVTSVSSIDVFTVNQDNDFETSNHAQPPPLLLFNMYSFINASNLDTGSASDNVYGGAYSGTVKVYYFYDMPDATAADIPFLIPEPSTFLSAGIAVVTGLGFGFARRRRRQSMV